GAEAGRPGHRGRSRQAPAAPGRRIRRRLLMSMPEITPFLMFEGRAEEAMSFYVELFGGEIVSILRYGPGEAGAEGSVNQARFRIRGQEVMCIDSPAKH